MGYSQRIIYIFLLIFLFSFPLGAGEKFRYPSNLERDPFEALIDKDGVINIRLVKETGDLKLSGIIYSPRKEDRLAIINNTSLKEGERIGRYKVKEIRVQEVVLVKEGKEIILKMEEE